MDDLLTDLRDRFEDGGYDVVTVTRNRGRIRVVVRGTGMETDALQSLTYDVVPESDVLGLDVKTESVEGSDGMSTVVTFRHRRS
jgi:hypothetical protein